MRIAQAAALTGLSPRQIRYYAERGVLPEAERSPGRHREFTDRDLRRLSLLKTLLAADVPPALTGRTLDGQLTAAERAQIDRLLEQHVATSHRARARLAGRDPAVSEPSGPPDISLMFDVYVLRTRLGAVLTAALTEAGVSATEYALLSLLQDTQPRTAAELAQVLGIPPATLGRQLTELVRRGWVARTAGGRRPVYALTAAGDQRYRAALPLAARVAAELDRGLRDRGEDPDTVRGVLQSVSTTLRSLLRPP